MQLPALSLSSLGLSIRQSKAVQGVQDQAWSPLGVGPRAGACLRSLAWVCMELNTFTRLCLLRGQFEKGGVREGEGCASVLAMPPQPIAPTTLSFAHQSTPLSLPLHSPPPAHPLPAPLPIPPAPPPLLHLEIVGNAPATHLPSPAR